VKKKFPLSLFGSQVKMGNKIIACVEEAKALKQQQQQQPVMQKPQTTSFAPEPKAPDDVQPTPQAGNKQSFAVSTYVITPTAQSVPDVLLAEDEVIQMFSNITNVEFTAPINDTRTQNAETPQESAKIQNDASEQQRVPDRAARTTGGIDVNIARPNNLVNEPQPGVETTTANESLKQKQLPKQQRTIRPEKDNKPMIAAAVVGVAALGAAVYISQ
jgi:hypothetical protein